MVPGPDSTIAELRADLERDRALPPLHELRLFHGARELQDGDSLEIEVQAVASASPAKAAEIVVEYQVGRQGR